eukprot:3294763-Rhodomonas_salina.1
MSGTGIAYGRVLCAVLSKCIALRNANWASALSGIELVYGATQISKEMAEDIMPSQVGLAQRIVRCDAQYWHSVSQ